ncbi:MAG: hypothetical protein MPK03_01560 [Alphaproteobacteria bacterium]|nr:hypothetical protein [Alphaproteobacteria bacterium]
MSLPDSRELFFDLYRCNTESEVKETLDRYGLFSNQDCWKDYGGDRDKSPVFGNQQSHPVAALVEKIVNSIDAILEKRCREKGIHPESSAAPRSIEKAVEEFFPEHKNWDVAKSRREQSMDIQIFAHGERRRASGRGREEVSLVVYDNGVGQRPEDFEKTFLSLLKGNKKKIHFVQGKYNMGGTGAIAFCGKEHRFQLVGSRRYDKNSDFGFTLVRRHTFADDAEGEEYRVAWYEYLVLDGKIPSFPANSLDLDLFNERPFETGSIIKLYSYDLPPNARGQISRDLYRNINEYLFEPALPILTNDRYAAETRAHSAERHLFGLKRQLEQEENKYIEDFFSEEVSDETIGRFTVTSYVFNNKVDGKNVKDTKNIIRNEFFKSGMSVLFSLNGQVHGHYTTEFITRSLGFHLLRDYLLIHVDCTDVALGFREDLFMSDRERLKSSDNTKQLRDRLAEVLKESRLKEINRRRKSAIMADDSETNEMLRKVISGIPFNDEITKLLDKIFDVDNPGEKPAEQGKGGGKEKENEGGKGESVKETFVGETYPSSFRITEKKRGEDGLPLIHLPLGGSRRITFLTDVEDQYFDRTNSPGEMQLALLDYRKNDTSSPTPTSPTPGQVKDFLNIAKSSPESGEIHVKMKPTKEVGVGDSIRIRATLSAPEGELEQIFLVKIGKVEKRTVSDKKKKEKKPETRLRLPQCIRVWKEVSEEDPEMKSWSNMDDAGESVSMDYETVVRLGINERGFLDAVFVNMDSNVFLNYRKGKDKEDEINFAKNKYLSSVYLHALFLYATMKSRNDSLPQEDGARGGIASADAADIKDVVEGLFNKHYAEFLLHVDPANLTETLEAILS